MPSLLLTVNSRVTVECFSACFFVALIQSWMLGQPGGFANLFRASLKLNLAGHLRDETVVQFLGRVVAGPFEFGLEGGHFDKAGQVAAGSDRDDAVGNVYAGDFCAWFLYSHEGDMR